jgi:hypothetical protein
VHLNQAAARGSRRRKEQRAVAAVAGDAEVAHAKETGGQLRDDDADPGERIPRGQRAINAEKATDGRTSQHGVYVARVVRGTERKTNTADVDGRARREVLHAVLVVTNAHATERRPRRRRRRRRDDAATDGAGVVV